jgi:hypothetical protein
MKLLRLIFALCCAVPAFAQKEALQRVVGTNTVTGSLSSAPFQVSTVAALKSVVVAGNATPNATQVYVNGYYAAGDGGEGYFVYNSGSASADNAGTVIAPNAGSGRWIRTVPNSTITISMFGAVGDGTTEATAAIQAALNSGYLSIMIPGGTYYTSTLTVPSNVTLFGLGSSLSILKLKNSTAAPLIKNNGATSEVTLRDFKINGNSAGQAGPTGNLAGVYWDTNVSKSVIENVWADSVVDWGFHIVGTDIILRGCRASNITGAASASAVRSGFLIGTGGVSPVAAHRITIDQCEVFDCTVPFTDGFILENGDSVTLSNSFCVSISYTGFKIKTNRTSVIGNKASGCLVGFQTQGSLSNLVLQGNISYRSLGSGFQFNQIDTTTPSRAWAIIGNQSIENGQDTGGGAITGYGFAFENSGSCTTDQVIIANNFAIDNQSVKTQSRGISFGSTGTYTNVLITGNVCYGNTQENSFGGFTGNSLGPSDYRAQGGQLQNSTGSGFSLGDAQSIERLYFWANDIPASSGAVNMTDGIGSTGFPGYLVTKPGWVRSITAKANSNLSAGTITLRTKVNGSPISVNAGLTTSAQSNQTGVQFPGNALLLGDIITCDYIGSVGLLPNGTLDVLVCVEIYH